MLSLKNILSQLQQGHTLSTPEAYSALQALFNDETTDAQRGAFLAMLSLRQETIDELAGFLACLRDHSLKVILPSDQPVIDIVGTGGDQLKTFNISTAASLIIASAGVRVAKHGGRSVTSQSGSADVLEALGIPLFEQTSAVTNSLMRHHFAFLFAPFFNPLLKSIAPLRRQLGLRTFFNLLAPLANPAQVQRQVIGIYEQGLLTTVVKALQATGSIQAMAVHSEDGMDEISLSSPTHIVQLKNQQIQSQRITPEDFGLQRCAVTDLLGGDAPMNAGIIQKIFSGEDQGPKRDIVLLNAAAGFIVADLVDDFSAGIAKARQCIITGCALTLLNQLSDLTTYD